MSQVLPHLRINAPQTIFEVFEDEIIIVSFFDGSYYSVRGSAAVIWQGIHAGARTQHIIDAFIAACPTQADQVTASLMAFFAELERARLVVPAEGTGADDQVVAVPAGDFQPPALESYTDMQDLLLLDPIHEVDETGWPQKAPDAQPNRA